MSSLLSSRPWWRDADTYHIYTRLAVGNSDANSRFNLSRGALEIRKTEIGLGDGQMEWLKLGDCVFAFERLENFACLLNFGEAFKIPKGEVLVASTSLEQGVLFENGALWMRLA